ncbi:MAG: ABC transporter substrate-binding protein [Acidimicrobiales bacterium]
MRPSRTLMATLTFGALMVGACGDDGGDDSIPMTGNRPTTTVEEEGEESAATFPVTVQAANGPVDIAEQPDSIVSLSPTATEMAFAIDAGGQVVAVDDQSDFPTEAPVTELSGVQPNVEAISGYEPDLVLVQDDTAIAELNALSIPVLLLPPAATLDDSYTQIEQLGQATGHPTEATELVETMRTTVDGLVADPDSTGDQSDAVTVYHELDNTLYTVTAESFIGDIYTLAGLANIAADIGGDGSGYVQISPEQVVDANPDWIFVAYPGDTAIADLGARPGWNQVTAVQSDQVVALDPDIASRWGPRSVELLRTILDTTGT